MKKITYAIVVAILCICFAGCGSTKNEGIQPDNSFFKGYTKISDKDYKTYSKTAEENGLGESKIVLEVALSDIDQLDSGDPTFGDIIKATGTTEENNKWSIVLDSTLLAKLEDYNKLDGHNVWIAGYYQGFSSVENMPSIFAVKYFDTTDGTEINTAFGALLELTYESNATTLQEPTTDVLNPESQDDSIGNNEPASYSGKETTTGGQNISTSQQQALSSAYSYVNYMNFSYEGLVDQLLYEGFSDADARYAADNCGANWHNQAVGSAKSYLNYSSFSYNGLIEQLEFEKFTHDQAVYGADNCGADWYAQAAASARSYLNFMSFSHSELVDQLVFEGFTYDQAEYGVSAAGL